MVDVESVVKYLLGTVGIFALVGVGLGLTGYIGIDTAADQLITDGEASFGEVFVLIIFIQSVFITWFVGPVVALVCGISNARDLPTSVSGLVTGAGSGIGFLLMAGIAIALMILGLPEAASGGGDSGGAPLTDQLGTMVLAAGPTLIVGAVSGVVGSVLFE